jgi:hypothetical protein
MNEIDYQEEWNNLEETFGAMSDEELTALADKAFDLTDIAQQALQSQFLARGLKIALVQTPPPIDEWKKTEQAADFDPEDLGLASLISVLSLDEAKQILTTLHDAGIPAYLGPENLEDANDFHGSFENGVEVKVRDADYERATRARTAAFPRQQTETEEEPPFVVHCPNCHSQEIMLEEVVAAASAPGSAPSQKFRWKCESCGHKWQDDGVEE